MKGIKRRMMMSESQIELNNNRKKQLGRFLEALPDLAKQLGPQVNEAYKEGVIDSKTKRLMAMAIALGAGCRNCVLGQAEAALDLGATKEEFLEAIAVVVSMRGTTGVAESLRVIQLLDELGKL
jgi:AhpD family alkylhydroperoxidase